MPFINAERRSVPRLLGLKKKKSGRSNWVRCTRYVWLLIVVGCSATAGSLPRTKTVESEALSFFELSPGIVIGLQPPVAYVMRPKAGIAAVDCRTGKILWKTTDVARPLALVGNRLLVQNAASERPGVLPIGILDRDDGSTVPLEAEIPLAPGAHALIDERLGESFSIRAWEDQGDLMVAWEYIEQDIGGTSPRPGDSPIVNRVEAAARLDLESGRVESIATPVAPGGIRLPPDLRERIDPGKGWSEPWRIGDVVTSVRDQAAQGGQWHVVLRRWDAKTGESLPESTLFDGQPLAQLFSANRQYLLVSSQTDQTPGGWDRYLWSIFSLEFGELVGTMRYHRSADHFSVIGSTLLHLARPFGRRVGDEWIEEPLKLRAVDLGSGTELWSVPLRDTSYRGPRPPNSRPARGDGT